MFTDFRGSMIPSWRKYATVLTRVQVRIPGCLSIAIEILVADLRTHKSILTGVKCGLILVLAEGQFAEAL
jgi:hypothetical protein